MAHEARDDGRDGALAGPGHRGQLSDRQCSVPSEVLEDEELGIGDAGAGLDAAGRAVELADERAEALEGGGARRWAGSASRNSGTGRCRHGGSSIDVDLTISSSMFFAR
jgi:hypothetical protein